MTNEPIGFLGWVKCIIMVYAFAFAMIAALACAAYALGLTVLGFEHGWAWLKAHPHLPIPRNVEYGMMWLAWLVFAFFTIRAIIRNN